MDVTVPIPHRARLSAAVGWSSFAIVLALVAYTVIGGPLDNRPGDPYAWAAAATGLFSATFAAVLLNRSPRHPMGWLFLIIGVTRAIAGAAQIWSVAALVDHPGRPGGDVAAWLQLWTPTIGLALTPLILVWFPDGRLPGPRWRIVPALTALALVLVGVVLPLGTWPYRGVQLLPDAPVPDEPAAVLLNACSIAGIGLTAVSAAIALAGIVVHARRSTGDTRQQVKWFGLGAAAAFVANVTAAVTGFGWVILAGVASVFVGLSFAVFRFRLYDIDQLIRRTLLYGGLTVLLVLTFAALDITVAVITGRGSTTAAAVSAFLVALLLRPARDRLQDILDRLYDRRAYGGVRLLRQLGQRVGREVIDPDRVRDTLRAALHDRELDVFYPVRHGRRHRPCRRGGAAGRPRRRVGRSDRHSGPPGRPRHRRRGAQPGRCAPARGGAAGGGDRSGTRPPAGRPERAGCRGCGPHAAGSWRPATASGDGSNAICTMVRSSGWSGWRCTSSRPGAGRCHRPGSTSC